MNEKKCKLYSNCKLINGFARAILYDLDFQRFYYSEDVLNSKLDRTNTDESDSFSKVDLFYKNNCCSSLSISSEINSLEYLSPSIISNAIIEFSETNSLEEVNNFINLITLISDLNCFHIFIRLNNSKDLNFLREFISFIDETVINSIQMILPFNTMYYTDDFVELIIKHQKIEYVLIEKSPFNKNFEDKIHFFSSDLDRKLTKSEVDFRVNIKLFTESQSHHTYFNHKLYIGPSGEIKNAPECDETFGFIQEIQSKEKLKELISTTDFQKYWFVHKEITDVCKDCEFRHMCVDNRIPYKRSNNEWYHKKECNYNPYIAKWEGEEGYLTLAECGVLSNKNGFTIDHKKIAKINYELWREEE